jgi:hypothetical protein
LKYEIELSEKAIELLDYVLSGHSDHLEGAELTEFNEELSYLQQVIRSHYTRNKRRKK